MINRGYAFHTLSRRRWCTVHMSVICSRWATATLITAISEWWDILKSDSYLDAPLLSSILSIRKPFLDPIVCIWDSVRGGPRTRLWNLYLSFHVTNPTLLHFVMYVSAFMNEFKTCGSDGFILHSSLTQHGAEAISLKSIE